MRWQSFKMRDGTKCRHNPNAPENGPFTGNFYDYSSSTINANQTIKLIGPAWIRPSYATYLTRVRITMTPYPGFFQANLVAIDKLGNTIANPTGYTSDNANYDFIFSGVSDGAAVDHFVLEIYGEGTPNYTVLDQHVRSNVLANGANPSEMELLVTNQYYAIDSSDGPWTYAGVYPYDPELWTFKLRPDCDSIGFSGYMGYVGRNTAGSQYYWEDNVPDWVLSYSHLDDRHVRCIFQVGQDWNSNPALYQPKLIISAGDYPTIYGSLYFYLHPVIMNGVVVQSIHYWNTCPIK